MQLKKNHIIKPYELLGHVWLVGMVCGSGEFNCFFLISSIDIGLIENSVS